MMLLANDDRILLAVLVQKSSVICDYFLLYN
jgi:hypothetical protein